MIQNIIPLDSLNNKGETALIIAVNREEVSKIKKLLSIGASPKKLTPEGKSSLKIAESNGNVKILNLLK